MRKFAAIERKIISGTFLYRSPRWYTFFTGKVCGISDGKVLIDKHTRSFVLHTPVFNDYIQPFKKI